MKNKMVVNITIAYFLMLSTILAFQVSQKEIQAIEPLPSELTVEDKLKSSVVLGVNSPVAIINEKQFIIDDSDSTATPIIHNGKIYIPVVLLETAYNANISYSNDTQEATVRLDNKALIFSSNSSIISVIDNLSAEEVSIEAEPKILNSRFYIPLRSFADIFEKEIFYADELIIITNMQDIFDPIEEVDTIEKLNMQVQKLPIVGNSNNLKSLVSSKNSYDIVSNSNIINKDKLVFEQELQEQELQEQELEEQELQEQELEEQELQEQELEEQELEEQELEEQELQEQELEEQELQEQELQEQELEEQELELIEEIIEKEVHQEKSVLINQIDDYNIYATKDYIQVYAVGEHVEYVLLNESIVQDEDVQDEDVQDEDVQGEDVQGEDDIIDNTELAQNLTPITTNTEEFLFQVEKINDNIEHILLSDNNLIISYCFSSIERETGFTQANTITCIYDITDINNIKKINMLENNGIFDSNLLMDNNFYSISKIDLTKDLNITPIANEYFYENNINTSIKYNDFELSEIAYFPDKNDNCFSIVTYIDLFNPEKFYTNVYFGMGDKIEIYNNNFYVATTNSDTKKSNVYLFEMLFNQELASSKISVFEEISNIEFDNSKKIFKLKTDLGIKYIDENLIEIK